MSRSTRNCCAASTSSGRNFHRRALGKNSVADVANVVSLCKQNRLICVLEDHDTTGYGEDGAAYSLDQAVNYWISVKSALVGHENWIVINIGNEPIGNTNPGQWPGGFQGEVKVTAGGSAITGWTVNWTFANGQTVRQAWNATVTSSGASVAARNMSYNGGLGAGASTTFGFLGSWNGTNSVPTVSCAAT